MVRKQVYLTEKQNALLAQVAEVTGKSQSELLREAVDWVGQHHEHMMREHILKKTAGFWKDRDDLPDWDALRQESDQRLASVYDNT